MTNTQSFAARELDILFKSSTDPDNRPIIEPFKDEILALCEKFGNNGESGGSAPYTVSALTDTIKKLLLQKPICPITGLDEEWVDVRDMCPDSDEEMRYQNSRCYSLFKSTNGKCWYLDAIVWKNGKDTHTGNAFLSIGGGKFDTYYSRQYIKSFPFIPKTFYVDVERVDGYSYIKNQNQLEKVFKYYDKKS